MVIVILPVIILLFFSLDFRNFAETKQTHPIDMQGVKHNYLICSEIGEGKICDSPSLGLDIQRSSVCHRHIGGRFSCASTSLCGERKEGAL